MSGASKPIRPQGGPFPFRLHDMISYCEAQGMQSVICWVLGGRGFIINDADKLVQILPIFFGKSKYKTFVRQLNVWDFDRIPSGPNKGTYIHPYFSKGNPEHMEQMNRKIKKKSPRAPPGTHSPRRRRQNSQQQPQRISSTQDLELGSLKSEISGGSHRLVNKGLDPVTSISPINAETGSRADDDNSFSGDSTNSDSFNDNIVTKAIQQHHCTFTDEYAKAVGKESGLLHYSDYFPYCDSPELWAPDGAGDISPIGEILKEYSCLFEQDRDVEEDIDKYLSPMLLDATTSAHAYEFLLSDPMLSPSSTGTNDNSTIETRKTEEDHKSLSPLLLADTTTIDAGDFLLNGPLLSFGDERPQDDSKSLFAGRSFFLVGGD